MHHPGIVAAGRLGLPRRSLMVVGIALALLVSAALGAVTTVRAGVAPNGTVSPTTTSEAPASLKAVIIVGPTHASTGNYLENGEEYAQLAESYGMDVRRVFHPHATWEAVMANVQGANLVMYLGHGNGWPSPYTPFQEKTKNGVGLNPYDGASQNDVKYYGAKFVRENWVLAPNSIVFLNHLCYSAGNGESGMARPTWDVARQRVDNFAAGFLAAGAATVFAYSHENFDKVIQALFTTNKTVGEIFRTPGTTWFGWNGWDPRTFDSQRTPGATNLLDPEEEDGFLRAITGDMSLTASEWAEGQGGSGEGEPSAPVLSDLSASATGGLTTLTASSPDLFTPNGDGTADSLAISYVVDREAFVDFEVANSSGNVVRTLSAWSPAGPGSASWDGKRDNGADVTDGTFTVTATPRDRTGLAGAPASREVTVLTTMRAPQASPRLFYAADGDGLAQGTALSLNLDAAATFWWKVVDADENVVRTYVNGVATAPGSYSWNWDGRDRNGAFVADGTYYSVMTVANDAGMYSEWLPVDVRAFRLTSAKVSPYVRGTKVRFYVDTAEQLSGKPKVKVFQSGVAAKTFYTDKVAPGRYRVTVAFSAAAAPGTVQIRVLGTDSGGQTQSTNYFFTLQ